MPRNAQAPAGNRTFAYECARKGELAGVPDENQPWETDHYAHIGDLYVGLTLREPNTPRTMENLRAIQQHEGTPYEQISQEWVGDLFDSGWPYGDVDECVYCGFQIPFPASSADLDSERVWRFVAFSHADGCAWVATHSHRIEPDIGMGQ